MKNILLIGNTKNANWLKMYKDASANITNTHVDQLDTEEVGFYIDQTNTPIFNSLTAEKLDNSDTIIFLNEIHENIYHYLTLLLHTSKRILNADSIIKYNKWSDKLLQFISISNLLKENDLGLIQLNGFAFSKKSDALQTLIPLPFVTKVIDDNNSSFGRKGISFINNIEELTHLQNGQNNLLLAQRQVMHDPASEYRTIILGNTNLGNMYREATETARTTSSNSIKLSKDIPEELTLQLIKLAQLLQLEFVGIDYALVDGKAVIYELNRFPYFKVFNNTVEINVAEHVLSYITKC